MKDNANLNATLKPLPDKGGVGGGFVLGIDLRCLPSDGSEGSGIAHASRAITHALCRTAPQDWKLKAYVPKGAQFDVELDCVVPQVQIAGSSRADLIKGLASSSCDVLFVPSGCVSLNLPVTAIPWVHDVDIFQHSEWFGESWFTRLRTTWMFRRGLRKAPLIFTVSEYTKKKIKDLGLASDEGMIVTGEGGDESLLVVDELDRRSSRERLVGRGVMNPFILMLGTVEPRKNIPFALSVFTSVLDLQPQPSFVIAGREGWKTQMVHHAISLASKKGKVIRLADVSEMQRRDLLISADLVLVPSLSEGFGLVALEGIQAGAAVLASNRGALPEIVGDTALPLEPDAWKLAIKQLLSDDAFKADWVKRQRASAQRFSWNASAQKIWDQLNKKDNAS